MTGLLQLLEEDRRRTAPGSPPNGWCGSCRSWVPSAGSHACGSRRRLAICSSGRGAFRLRLEHDRAPWVSSAQWLDPVSLHALEPHPDVGLDVLHDVADVERAVGVRQRGGDEKLAGHEWFVEGSAMITWNCFKIPCLPSPPLEPPHAPHRQGTSSTRFPSSRSVTGRNYVKSKSAKKNVGGFGERVSLDIVLGYPARGVIETVRKPGGRADRPGARRVAGERQRGLPGRLPCRAARR